MPVVEQAVERSRKPEDGTKRDLEAPRDVDSTGNAAKRATNPRAGRAELKGEAQERRRRHSEEDRTHERMNPSRKRWGTVGE